MKERRAQVVIFAILLGLALWGCGRPSPSYFSGASSERFWPVSQPEDSQLNQAHPLIRFMRAATARELPLTFFRELIKSNSAVTVIEGDWPTYQPGVFYGGTISMPSSNRPESWTAPEWSSFYNELFHAWYGLVFSQDPKYAKTRAEVWTKSRLERYVLAHPSDPKLALEEAWSETIASIMIQLAPLKINDVFKYPSLNSFSYCIGKTVAPVSHSDRPGYTPDAENTYPDEYEYAVLFQLLTAVNPPPGKPSLI